MSEEQNQASEVEVAEPQEDSTQESMSEGAESQEQGHKQRPSHDDQERNWKAARESIDKAEKRALEAEYRASQYEKQVTELTTAMKEYLSGGSKKHEVEEEDESDIPTIAVTKKILAREGKKATRAEIESYMAEKAEAEAPDRLKREYSDFDSVVTVENINYLKKHKPVIAASIDRTDGLYNKGVLAYEHIKALGLNKQDSVTSMKQDASRNTAKPVSPNAIAAKNSVGDANVFAKGLTPELKKQLYQEMLDAIKKS